MTCLLPPAGANPSSRLHDRRRSHRRSPAQACAHKQATEQERLAHPSVEKRIPIVAISKCISHQSKEPQDPDLHHLAKAGNSEDRREHNHRNDPLGWTKASNYPAARRKHGAIKAQTDGRNPACAQCWPHPNEKQARDERERIQRRAPEKDCSRRDCKSSPHPRRNLAGCDLKKL